MPKISVLVPVCNVDAYLEQCLESLIKQSFTDIQIICVDDGSTDRSGSILDKYARWDSRFKVIHKRNTGYGNTMNIALDHAEGEYIAILESDDFAEPDMLQKLYETALEQDVDVVKGDYYHYLNTGDSFVNRLKGYIKYKILNVSLCPDILNMADSIWSCLYKHSFLIEHNIRFHETPGASYQDISFALQTWIYAERVYFIEDALLHYRRDNPNSSMNNPHKLFCVFDEYEWIEDKLRGVINNKPMLRQYLTASKYRDYFNHYYRVGVQYQYALLLRLNQSFYEDKKKKWIQESAFISIVWEQLCDIEMDMNNFFSRTAKWVDDKRLDLCNFENRQVYADAFFKTLRNYSKVFLYGAGQVGQRLAKVFLDQGVKVDAFVVTKIVDKNKICMGIPVLELCEVIDLADTCAIVISVTEWSQYELYVNLERNGFRHIFRMDAVVSKRSLREDEK